MSPKRPFHSINMKVYLILLTFHLGFCVKTPENNTISINRIDPFSISWKSHDWIIKPGIRRSDIIGCRLRRFWTYGCCEQQLPRLCSNLVGSSNYDIPLRHQYIVTSHCCAFRCHHGNNWRTCVRLVRITSCLSRRRKRKTTVCLRLSTKGAEKTRQQFKTSGVPLLSLLGTMPLISSSPPSLSLSSSSSSLSSSSSSLSSSPSSSLPLSSSSSTSLTLQSSLPQPSSSPPSPPSPPQQTKITLLSTKPLRCKTKTDFPLPPPPPQHSTSPLSTQPSHSPSPSIPSPPTKTKSLYMSFFLPSYSHPQLSPSSTHPPTPNFPPPQLPPQQTHLDSSRVNGHPPLKTHSRATTQDFHYFCNYLPSAHLLVWLTTKMTTFEWTLVNHWKTLKQHPFVLKTVKGLKNKHHCLDTICFSRIKHRNIESKNKKQSCICSSYHKVSNKDLRKVSFTPSDDYDFSACLRFLTKKIRSKQNLERKIISVSDFKTKQTHTNINVTHPFSKTRHEIKMINKNKSCSQIDFRRIWETPTLMKPSPESDFPRPVTLVALLTYPQSVGFKDAIFLLKTWKRFRVGPAETETKNLRFFNRDTKKQEEDETDLLKGRERWRDKFRNVIACNEEEKGYNFDVVNLNDFKIGLKDCFGFINNSLKYFDIKKQQSDIILFQIRYEHNKKLIEEEWMNLNRISQTMKSGGTEDERKNTSTNSIQNRYKGCLPRDVSDECLTYGSRSFRNKEESPKSRKSTKKTVDERDRIKIGLSPNSSRRASGTDVFPSCSHHALSVSGFDMAAGKPFPSSMDELTPDPRDGFVFLERYPKPLEVIKERNGVLINSGEKWGQFAFEFGSKILVGKLEEDWIVKNALERANQNKSESGVWVERINNDKRDVVIRNKEKDSRSLNERYSPRSNRNDGDKMQTRMTEGDNIVDEFDGITIHKAKVFKDISFFEELVDEYRYGENNSDMKKVHSMGKRADIAREKLETSKSDIIDVEIVTNDESLTNDTKRDVTTINDKIFNDLNRTNSTDIRNDFQESNENLVSVVDTLESINRDILEKIDVDDYVTTTIPRRRLLSISTKPLYDIGVDRNRLKDANDKNDDVIKELENLKPKGDSNRNNARGSDVIENENTEKEMESNDEETRPDLINETENDEEYFSSKTEERTEKNSIQQVNEKQQEKLQISLPEISTYKTTNLKSHRNLATVRETWRRRLSHEDREEINTVTHQGTDKLQKPQQVQRMKKAILLNARQAHYGFDPFHEMSKQGKKVRENIEKAGRDHEDDEIKNRIHINPKGFQQKETKSDERNSVTLYDKETTSKVESEHELHDLVSVDPIQVSEHRARAESENLNADPARQNDLNSDNGDQNIHSRGDHDLDSTDISELSVGFDSDIDSQNDPDLEPDIIYEIDHDLGIDIGSQALHDLDTHPYTETGTDQGQTQINHDIHSNIDSLIYQDVNVDIDPHGDHNLEHKSESNNALDLTPLANSEDKEPVRSMHSQQADTMHDHRRRPKREVSTLPSIPNDLEKTSFHSPLSSPFKHLSPKSSRFQPARITSSKSVSSPKSQQPQSLPSSHSSFTSTEQYLAPLPLSSIVKRSPTVSSPTSQTSSLSSSQNTSTSPIPNTSSSSSSSSFSSSSPASTLSFISPTSKKNNPSIIRWSPRETIFTDDEKTFDPDSDKTTLKLGVTLSYGGRFPWLMYKTRPALELAAMKIRAPEGPLPGMSIRMVFSDSNCSNTIGSLAGIDLYVKNLAHVFIGPACDYAVSSLAKFSFYWRKGIPLLTAGALVRAFERRDMFKLLTRVQGSYSKSANFFMTMMDNFGWNLAGFSYYDNKYDGVSVRSSCFHVIEPIFLAIQHRIGRKPFFISSKVMTAEKAETVLLDMSHGARIVVLCASAATVREIMIKAHDLNFDNGEYAFFNIDLFNSVNSSTPWYNASDTDERNAKARKAYEALMTVTLRMPTSKEYKEFSTQVKDRAAQMFPGFNYGENEVNSFVGAFHDAVLLYALALNETLEANGSISDGKAITRRMWNRTFEGITGNVSIDANGDRNADYSLLDMDPETGRFEVVANYFGNKRKYEPVPGRDIHWAGGRKGPPPDTPKCGFDGSKCPPDEPFPEYAIVIIVLGSLLLIVLIAVIFIYRHIKLEAELAEMNWRVRWDDIWFRALEKHKRFDKHGSRISIGKGSIPSDCSGDTLAGNKQLFTKTGYYKSAIVAIKPINRSSIAISKPLLLEVKRVKDLQNNHIARFVGACIDFPNVCILTEYCPKGSLEDVLENDQIKLDWLFRYSIMQDIVRGMAYLQGTEIRSHGGLKSSNCVVDSRFVVKITDFGLHYLRGPSPLIDDQDSYSAFHKQLWTAPELLRMTNHPPEGTIKGDVYSFAILCQEIVYRNGAFHLESLDLSPKEIVQKVKNGTRPYFRPTLEEYDCPSDELAGVIRKCWSEDPADRPDFHALKSIIRKLNRDGDKGNILDNLLSRMEQYANNLEALVEERTADYLQQKKKAEDLLYSMLPKKVAGHLIRGESVTAEWYESVSIYFSDICGFTAMSAESTPMQVVDLLNDLYTTFDSIVENFDVYKVETIGDAYMVVSGLPDRNGIIHAREIARMSLSLLKATMSFRIRHRPKDQLKLRIGIHTGPVCAGVVGLKMPRYCLFGDTVNTCSRMESNGSPLKIHVSSICKDVLDTFGSFELECRGNVEMKGKGPVVTYWLLGEKNTSDSPGVSLNIL